MQKRRSSVVWLVLPGLWFACERARPLGNGPDGGGDAGEGTENGDAGSGGSGAVAGASAGIAGSSGIPVGGSNAIGGSANAGTSGSSGCSFVTHPAFDVSHCETPTFSMGDSTCGPEETRAALRCGEPGSQFDATCCRRKQCNDDADCDSAGRCLPRIVQTPQNANSGSLVEECSPTCSGCSCSGTDDVDRRGYCVNADEGPARFDCPVSGVPCAELSSWRSAVENQVDHVDQIGGGGAGGGIVDEMQSCLDRIDDELGARCSNECVEPGEPFDLSHCERSPFLSGQRSTTCSEEQAREVLNCGAPGGAHDPNCCLRQQCRSDEGCANGGSCIPSTLGVPGNLAITGRVFDCHASCDGCRCSWTADAGPKYDAYCIAPEEDVSRFDCPVSEALCSALVTWRDGLPAYRDELLQRNDVELADRIQACLDRVAAELKSRCEDL
jgi:hypothetical protein